MDENKCCCCSEEVNNVVINEYVCYCNHVSEQDIIQAIENGATTVESVIKVTGAMKNSNCAVNNPKSTCCYPDIIYVFNKYRKSIED